MNIKDYCSQWWKIIVQPIFFFTKLKEEDWREDALSFLLITAWQLGFFASIIIFIIQYIPIGATLVEGLVGFRFFLILPVLITLIFAFFLLTFLILGGAFSLGFFIAFYLLGGLLHYVYSLFLAGKGKMNKMIQYIFYSTAAMQSLCLVFIMMLFTKFGSLHFDMFRVGFNLVYYLTLLYLYGLWAIAGRKVYNIPKWKAFVGALVPIIALLIFGVIFDKIALSRLQPWIT